MAENAGRIEYEFVAETDQVLKAGTVVDKATDKMAKSFNKVDKSTRQLNTQMDKTAKGVKRAFGSNLGQAGIQLQQFTGQIQGGQSAMVALAQQSADLGIVLGAPLVGVVVSLAAVLAGSLMPSLMDSASAMDELEKAIENTKAVMTLGAGGVVEYTKEIKELNKVSEQLAKIKLAEGILDQNKVIESSSKLIVESAENTSSLYKSTFKDLRSLTESVAADIGGDMNDVADAIRGGQNIGTAGSYLNRDLDKISSKFEITREEALRLGLALSDVAQGGGAVAIKSLQNVTEDLSASYGYSNEQLTKLSSGMVEYFIKTKNATDGINELRKALFGKGQDIGDETEVVNKAGDAYAQMSLSLMEQKIALEEGERAALEFRLQLSGLEEAQKQAILAQYDGVKALESQKEESDKLNKSLEDQIDNWIKIGEQATERANRKDQQQTETLTRQVQTIGLTPLEEIEARYDKEFELLRQAEEKGIEIKGTYAEREIELQRQKAEQIKNINKGQLEDQKLFTQSQGQLLSSVGDLFGSYASTMEVQNKKDFERKKKFQTAQALINTAMAVSNALAAAPPPINFALAGVAGAMGAMQVNAIQNQQYSGGRQYGGPVSQGMYRVNETGVPEVYSHGGKDYLMNTKNANIKPLEQSSGNMPQIIINNNGPDKAYVTYDEAANIAKVQIGREAGKIAKGQGSMFKAIRSGTSAKGNARN